MRYRLSDEEADPARLLLPRAAPFRLAEVAGAESGGAPAVVQNFVHGMRPQYLPLLRRQTEREAGFGHDVAASMYDDDLDPDDEPFEGVLITSQVIDDEVVLSREAYERLVDALLALPPPE